MKKRDIVVCGGILIVAAALYAGFRPGETGGYAVVKINGEEAYRLPLQNNTQIEIKQQEQFNTVVIENGFAYISEASCPDKLCVKQPKISKNNELIVCLPNKVVMEIENGQKREVDGVAR